MIDVILFIAEIIWNLAAVAGIDPPTSRREDTSRFPWGRVVAMCLLGGGIGFGVSLALPHALLPLPWLRLAALIAMPLSMGWVAFRLARWRARRWGLRVDPWRHAAYGAAFTWGYLLVRFVATARASG